MSTYILLKDYINPYGDIPAGTKVIWNDKEGYCVLDKKGEIICTFYKLTVESNKEWFKKEEPVYSSQPISRETWIQTDTFVWTDELVKEFKNTFYHWEKGQPNISDIEQFKQSKVKKEEPKQWEILSFKSDAGHLCSRKEDGKYYYSNHGGWTQEVLLSPFAPQIKIHSVKRIRDNEILSVDNETNHGKIIGFKIDGEQLIVLYPRIGDWQFLNSVENIKSKPDEPIPIKVEWLSRIASNNPNCYEFSISSKEIPSEKIEPIKKAIEFILNNKETDTSMFDKVSFGNKVI